MLIIDADVAQEFTDKTDEAKQLARWLLTRGSLTIGGRNSSELVKTQLRNFIIQLERAGKVKKYASSIVDAEEEIVSLLPIRSDDPHVISLARVSGARVIYTKDQALIFDFTNTRIVPRPRGKCYRYANRHKHLLS